jgi:uncharacterized membrane protein YhaH (DUF805 family)
MFTAIRHGLTNLTNVQGRDSRPAFWYWFLFLYLITTAISIVVVWPMMGRVMGSVMQAAAAQAANPAPDQAAAQAAVMSAMGGSVGDMIPVIVTGSLITALILVCGLAAALVRRLHDSGLSGWWALLPAGFQAVSAASVPAQMVRLQEGMQAMAGGDPAGMLRVMQGAYSWGPMAGWAALASLILLGVRESGRGANRFGEAPFVVD